MSFFAVIASTVGLGFLGWIGWSVQRIADQNAAVAKRDKRRGP